MTRYVVYGSATISLVIEAIIGGTRITYFSLYKLFFPVLPVTIRNEKANNLGVGTEPDIIAYIGGSV